MGGGLILGIGMMGTIAATNQSNIIGTALTIPMTTRNWRHLVDVILDLIGRPAIHLRKV